MSHDATPSRVDALRSTCQSLQNQPLFHLSLHSKELFHSNFIAWLFETYPGASADAMSGIVPRRETSTHRIQREKNHLDLAVELPGLAPFVIENKVFAPPDEAQLERYTEGALAGLADPTLILLSLGAPNWPDGTYTTRGDHPHRWRFVSYLDLADRLAGISQAVGGFDGDLIRHYVGFIRDLHALASTVGVVSDDEPIALGGEPESLLRSIRVHDAIGKLRARSAIAATRAHSEGTLRELPIRWEALYSNASPLNAAFLDKGNGDWLGWQYQSGQWRVVVITNHHYGADPDSRARRHAYVAEHYSDWFDFDPIASLTGRSVAAVPKTESEGGYLG